MTKRKPTEWNKHLIKVYKELKKKNSTITLKDAMKIAKRTYIRKKTGPKVKAKRGKTSSRKIRR